MKKTMTREDFNKLFGISGNNFCYYNGKDFYDTLSKAGISFDIYTDSEGQIIKPGDMCEFWDEFASDNVEISRFFGVEQGDLYISTHANWTHCRKLPAEVWEPVPMEDLVFNADEGTYLFQDKTKWAKTKVTNGKLEGVRK